MICVHEYAESQQFFTKGVVNMFNKYVMMTSQRIFNINFNINKSAKNINCFALVLSPYFSDLQRRGDLLPEYCEFFLPHSHFTPSLGVNPFEFLDEFLSGKQSLGYPSVKIS